MVGIDQVVAIVANADDLDALQRRLAQVEPAQAFGVGQLVERGGQLPPLAPILVHQRHGQVLVNDLQRLLLALPQHTGAQHLVAVVDCLPGGPQPFGIQPLHIGTHLVDVVTTALLVQRVEQHALLHRRQRVDVFDLRRRYRQRIELGLAQARQRKSEGVMPCSPASLACRQCSTRLRSSRP